MSQSFSFPPPPPPPPKPSPSQASYQQQSGRGGQRGRGGYPSTQNNTRGGNTGGRYAPRGSYRGGGAGSRGDSVNRTSAFPSSYSRNETSQNTYSRPSSQNGQKDGSLNPPQKRPHSTAFNGQSTNAQTAQRSRPLAPPPVPSFGIDFNTLLSKKVETSVATKPSPQSVPARKTNLLGLTPTFQALGANSDSESDAEEESKLANSMSNDPNALTFEYNGKPASLSTPEEIALWVAERRKKWPTEAKREVARQQAEEKKKKYEAEKAARLEANKAAAKERQVEREKQKTEKEKSLLRQKMLQEQIAKAARQAKEKESNNNVQTPAQIKAERLRQKAERIAQRLRQAESLLDKETENAAAKSSTEPQASQPDQTNETQMDENNIDNLLAQVDKIAAAQQDLTLTSPLDTIDDSTDEPDSDDEDLESNPDNPLAEDTSTSGSSDSDSDDAPDQFSSKQDVLPPGKPPRQDTRPLCTTFTKTGRCKFGRRCHYRHEKLARDKTGGQHGKDAGPRKGLYQVMVEKELESERRRALRVIIGLGEQGWLDEADDGDDEDGGVRV